MAGRVLPCCITVTTFLIVILFACCPVVRAIYCFGREGEVRLADGPSSREGRVDICDGRYWRTPCQDTWGIEETRVVCRELGFCQQGGRLVTGHSYQEYILFDINEVNCTGDEATLSNCSVTLYYSSNCGNYVGAGVSCYSTPKRPTNVEITFIDSSSIQVSWLPPDMGNCTNVDGYRIICSDDISCNRPYSFVEETPSHSLNVTFHDPYDNDNFNSCFFYCLVSGNNSAGVGPASYVYGPTPSPPRNVTVKPSGQTSLLIEWLEPKQIYERYGEYYVVCGTQTRPRVSSRYIYSITETAVNITGLSVFTRYECCVTVNVASWYSSFPSCVNATTAPDLPTAPLAVNVIEVTYKSIQLEWSPPQPANGTISHYTISCLQANGTIVSLNTTADGLETVSNLQELTNYTCCISATNEAGEGNQTCVDARTERGSPTEPQEVAIVSAYTNGITLTWTEPAESYGQAILFYSINCTSAHHNAEIQRAYNTSVEVSGLNANTNYTCCVSAGNSVGVGLHQCIVVMTAINTEQPQSGSNLVTAVSAGALLAVLLLLCIVITCITCCCCYKRRTSKQVTLQGQQSTADPVYDVPEDIELKEKGSPQSNNTSHRHVQYKEEVDIRYENSANKKQREKKPMIPIATPPITQPGQQSSEKIYQPLIPPKTYKEQEVSAYQDLAFETRDAGTDMANNSEGQYEPIRKNDEDNQYESLSFGGGGTSQEGAYQLSFQREDANTYETIQPPVHEN
ncbi:tyrosine-protein phosphatase Lar-like isoform X3 [Halichondria panicea]|uniref:tyrosine-protein phosphatase Lar-like isoform X3 n=1 Tax=Halichondria panicea TaxID=6063 RepID=UPI00312B5181